MNDPTPTPIPPTPTNWPKLLTDLWAFQPVKLGVGVLAIFGLGMAFEGWRQHQPAVPVPVIEFTQAEVTALPGQYVTVRVKTSGRSVKWKADPRLTVNVEMLADAKAKQFMSPVAGRFWIASYTATAGWLPWHAEPSDPAHCVVVVGDAPPVPPGPGPVPPVPPVPPQPQNYEGPLPANATEMITLLQKAGDGLKVLIVYDVSKSLPPAQYEILMGRQVRDMLASKGQFRIWDKGVNAANEAKEWQDMLAKAQGKAFPWLIVSK